MLDGTNPIAHGLVVVISDAKVEEVEQTEVPVSDEINALDASLS